MHAVLGSAQHAMGGAGGGAGAGGALRQEFLAAKEASPCLLHLRDIASLTRESILLSIYLSICLYTYVACTPSLNR